MSKWTKLRDKIVAKICKALGINPAGAGEGEACEGNRAREEPEAAPAPSSTSTELVLDFRYGGFDGSRAKEDPRCRLSLVSIGKEKIAYKWETDIPADWKRDGTLVVVAAFFWDGARWVGGKFEWTDESRSSRSAANIRDGYHGWDAAAWDKAARRAFCVVSADGKWRSNLIGDVAPSASSVPAWDKAVHASCWDGETAKRRMMNILSPGFSDAKFGEYVAWMKSRGCDAAHVFLINQADGEGAGQNCATKPDHAKLAKRRIEALRKDGFAVVPWVIADDSDAWIKDLFAHPEERVKTLADAGLFADASYVVVGLEMDEASGGSSGWPKVAAAIRKHFKGRLGTHHQSGSSFAYAGLGEIVLGQLDPGCSASDIKKQVAAIRAKGKAAVGFEYARSPDRAKAQAALDAGAVGVGNW